MNYWKVTGVTAEGEEIESICPEVHTLMLNKYYFNLRSLQENLNFSRS